jgi:aspartate/methionine/tyrosine aminotransferase
MRLATRIHRLETEGAFEVLARARLLEAQGRTVAHLELGEPDLSAPPHVVDAAIRALRDGATRYTPPAGLFTLREAVADVARAAGVPAAPERVFITSGAKPMLYYALVALLEPGTEMLVPDPGFSLYGSVARFIGARSVGYRVAPNRAGGVDPDEIRARVTGRTRVLVLNSPHNPTGTVLGPDELDALVQVVQRHNLTVISDEIYSRLVFDGTHASIAARPGMAERTVVVDGFSKAYAMTGWRLGYGIVPAGLRAAIEALIVNTTTCAPAFVQHAGIAALRGPQVAVEALRVSLRQRRDRIVHGLGQLPGITCATPAGAFYAFPCVEALLEKTGLDIERFAQALLDDFGLACLPGTAFGRGGAGHLRLSFASAPSAVDQAVELLRAAAGRGAALRPISAFLRVPDAADHRS